MLFQKILSSSAGTIGLLALALPAGAAANTQGIWYDHEGRGAVEIRPCAKDDSRLCGYVVYVKKQSNIKRCGMQIIGNVKSNGSGWIYSPKRGRSFPLSLKRLDDNRLRVVGNAGSRFFSRTFTWKRAPDSIVNCPGASPVVESKAAPRPEAPPATVIGTSPAKNSKTHHSTQQSGTIGTAATAASATAALITTSAANDRAPTASQASKPQATRNAKPAEAMPAVTEREVPTAEQTSPAAGQNEEANDLTPPGGLSKSNGSLDDVKGHIRKFVKTGGKGKCKFRIPYVGRTINVPCT